LIVKQDRSMCEPAFSSMGPDGGSVAALSQTTASRLPGVAARPEGDPFATRCRARSIVRSSTMRAALSGGTLPETRQPRERERT
jgi:hypothetical protein